MVSPFAGRGLQVEKPVRIPILNPDTMQAFSADVDGIHYEAYIEVLSADSAKADAIRNAQRQRRLNRRGAPNQNQEEDDNVELLAELTTGWCIVSISDGDVIDAPATKENALDLYANREWRLYYRQGYLGAHDSKNFMPARRSAS